MENVFHFPKFSIGKQKNKKQKNKQETLQKTEQNTKKPQNSFVNRGRLVCFLPSSKFTQFWCKMCCYLSFIRSVNNNCLQKRKHLQSRVDWILKNYSHHCHQEQNTTSGYFISTLAPSAPQNISFSQWQWATCTHSIAPSSALFSLLTTGNDLSVNCDTTGTVLQHFSGTSEVHWHLNATQLL